MSTVEFTDSPDDVVIGEGESKADKVPRRVKSTPPKKSPLPPFRAGVISKFMKQVYEAGGGALINFGHEDYGQSIIDIAEPAGIVWEKLAKRHEWLRRFFDRIMTTSEFSELFWIHFPILMLVMKDTGLLRPMTASVTEEFAEEMAKEARNGAVPNAA